jgi:hypothetical protein
MGRRRVPEVDDQFDAYICSSSKLLESGTPAGWVRMGLSNAEFTRWIAYRDEWIVLYPKYTDVGQRTKTITLQKNKLKKDFAAFTTKPLGKIAMSDTLTADDQLTLRIGSRGKKRSTRGAMNADIPSGSLHALGGGMVKVRTRLVESEGRCRKHPLCDVIEMKYLLIDAAQNFTNPLVTVEDCTQSIFSRTAIWITETGTRNPGKRMIGFLRYVNIAKPDHNSAWSNMISVIVG